MFDKRFLNILNSVLKITDARLKMQPAIYEKANRDKVAVVKIVGQLPSS